MFCVELFAVVAATHCNIHGLGVALRDNFEIESTLPTPTSPPPDTKLSKVIAHGSIISAFSPYNYFLSSFSVYARDCILSSSFSEK